MVTFSSVPIQFCIPFRDSTVSACLLGLMRGLGGFLAKQIFIVIGSEIDLIFVFPSP